MSDEVHIGLDNSALRGRLRQPADWDLASRQIQTPNPTPQPQRRSDYINFTPRPLLRQEHGPNSDPSGHSTPAITPALATSQNSSQVPSTTLRTSQSPLQADSLLGWRPTSQRVQPAPTPAPTPTPIPDSSQHQEVFNTPTRPARPHRYSKLQLGLVGMACLVFMTGAAVSLQTLQTNHTNAVLVAGFAKKVDEQTNSNQNSPLPSTTKPSSQAISQYVVAPDLPRYIKIAKLNVFARVLQIGIDGSGALGAPSNVYDTAWYTGSAKPGQPGATLIDGHVSSWTTPGVFSGIKGLVAGDNLQIVRGDGVVLNYRVVKTQTYDANNVDMQAAVTPVTAGKPGLNLITCAGQVKKGTGQFSQRVIVFAEQI